MVTATKPTITTPPKKEVDWLSPVAVGIGVVGIGVGLYFFMKKPPKEVKEGEWADAGIILARKTFKVTVTTEEAGWKAANEELARKPFEVTIREAVEGDWLPADIELASESFHVTIREVVEGDWLPANTELARKTFQVTITSAWPTVNVTTLAADRITHNSATLRGSRGPTDYAHFVYFQIGKTTSYELGSTPKQRMYGSKYTEEFDADRGGLQPNTTYHYRAVAKPDEINYPDLPTGYGADRTFKTKAEVVVGFDMRVTGAPAEANYWSCDFENGGIHGWSDFLLIGSTWKYTGAVSDQNVDIIFMCYVGEGGAALEMGRFQYVFRLYAGAKYVYNFATHEFYEE